MELWKAILSGVFVSQLQMRPNVPLTVCAIAAASELGERLQTAIPRLHSELDEYDLLYLMLP